MGLGRGHRQRVPRELIPTAAPRIPRSTVRYAGVSPQNWIRVLGLVVVVALIVYRSYISLHSALPPPAVSATTPASTTPAFGSGLDQLSTLNTSTEHDTFQPATTSPTVTIRSSTRDRDAVSVRVTGGADESAGSALPAQAEARAPKPVRRREASWSTQCTPVPQQRSDLCVNLYSDSQQRRSPPTGYEDVPVTCPGIGSGGLDCVGVVTVIVMTHAGTREEVQRDILYNYLDMDLVARVLLIWNDVKHEPRSWLSQLALRNDRLQLVRETENVLFNRHRHYDMVETSAVFVTDDDVVLCEEALQAAYARYMQQPREVISFTMRTVVSQGLSLAYRRVHSAYGTHGTVFLMDRSWMEAFVNDMPKQMVEFMLHNKPTCEDFALLWLVANATGAPVTVINHHHFRMPGGDCCYHRIGSPGDHGMSGAGDIRRWEDNRKKCMPRLIDIFHTRPAIGTIKLIEQCEAGRGPGAGEAARSWLHGLVGAQPRPPAAAPGHLVGGLHEAPRGAQAALQSQGRVQAAHSGAQEGAGQDEAGRDNTGSSEWKAGQEYVDYNGDKVDWLISLGYMHKGFHHTIEKVNEIWMPRTIYVVTAAHNCGRARLLAPNIRCLDEDTFLPQGYTLAKVRERLAQSSCASAKRASWYFQQFIKFGAALYLPDLSPHYVVWDSDSIPLRKFDLFNRAQRRARYLASWYHNNRRRVATVAYQKAYTALTGLPHSQMVPSDPNFHWVAHMMVMRRAVVRDIVRYLEERAGPSGAGQVAWLEHVMRTAGALSAPGKQELGFSEYYTYGMWLHRFFPNDYEVFTKCATVRRQDKRPLMYKDGACEPPSWDLWKSQCDIVMVWEVQKFDAACDDNKRNTRPEAEHNIC